MHTNACACFSCPPPPSLPAISPYPHPPTPPSQTPRHTPDACVFETTPALPWGDGRGPDICHTYTPTPPPPTCPSPSHHMLCHCKMLSKCCVLFFFGPLLSREKAASCGENDGNFSSLALTRSPSLRLVRSEQLFSVLFFCMGSLWVVVIWVLIEWINWPLN